MASILKGFKAAGTKFGKTVSSGTTRAWQEHGPHETFDKFKSSVTDEETYKPLTGFISPIINVGKVALGTAYRTGRSIAAKAGIDKKIENLKELTGITKSGVEENFKKTAKDLGVEVDDIHGFSLKSLKNLKSDISDKSGGLFNFKDGFDFIPSDFNPEAMAKRVPLNEAPVNIGIKMDKPADIALGKQDTLEFTAHEWFTKLGIDNKIDMAESAKDLAKNATNVENAFQNPVDIESLFNDYSKQTKEANVIDMKTFEGGINSSMGDYMSAKHGLEDTMVVEGNTPMNFMGDYVYVETDPKSLVNKVKDVDKDALVQAVDYTHESGMVFKSTLDDTGTINMENIWNNEALTKEPFDKSLLSDDASGLRTGKKTWENLLGPLEDGIENHVDIPYDAFEQQMDKAFTGTNVFAKTINSHQDSAMTARVNKNPYEKAFEGHKFYDMPLKHMDVREFYNKFFKIICWPATLINGKWNDDSHFNYSVKDPEIKTKETTEDKEKEMKKWLKKVNK